MTSLKNLIVGTALSVGLFSCQAQPAETTVSEQISFSSEPSAIKTLTVTKVKKPWYAWRGLVVGKMEQSIPEFRKVNGLKEKYFSFTENHEKFGGFYFWETEQEARNLFDQAWYSRIEKKYGEKGIVEFYEVQSINTVAAYSDFPSKDLYAAISIGSAEPQISETSAAGLLKWLTLKNASGQICYLTIWKGKEQAIRYFKDQHSVNEFFDIPLFMVNH